MDLRRLARAAAWPVRRFLGLFDLHHHIDDSTRSVAVLVDGSKQETTQAVGDVVGEFTAATTESLGLIGEELRNVSATVADLDGRIKSVDHRVAALDARVARVERMLASGGLPPESSAASDPHGLSSASG